MPKIKVAKGGIEYSGVVSQLPIEQAMLPQLEEGNDRITVIPYNPQEDIMYVMYDFFQSEASYLGLQGKLNYFLYYTRWIIVGGLIGLWIYLFIEIPRELESLEVKRNAVSRS